MSKKIPPPPLYYRVYVTDGTTGEIQYKNFLDEYVANCYRYECTRWGKNAKLVRVINGKPAVELRK